MTSCPACRHPVGAHTRRGICYHPFPGRCLPCGPVGYYIAAELTGLDLAQDPAGQGWG